MKTKSLPLGWDESRVRRVLEHYENQSDDDAVKEDDLAYNNRTYSLVGVPIELVPAVRELIAKRTGRSIGGPRSRRPSGKRKAPATRARRTSIRR